MCYIDIAVYVRNIIYQQAFREFLVSPALISNTSAGLSHVKCKILTYFCDVIHLFALVFSFYLIGYSETNLCGSVYET